MGGRLLSSYTTEELKEQKEHAKIARTKYLNTERGRAIRRAWAVCYRKAHPEKFSHQAILKKYFLAGKKYDGNKYVFICEKCGQYASSQNPECKICKKCYVPLTKEQKNKYQREYYWKNKEKAREYNFQYRTKYFGLHLFFCDHCGKKSLSKDPKQTICKKCRGKIRKIKRISKKMVCKKFS